MPEHPLPVHTWFTSPARSTADAAHAKELPLHLVLRILNHIDNVGDLARLTRASRLIYYMTLPRLYETVTLRSHAQIRFVDGRPEGYGSGSPFAMGLNTLVSRNFGDYVRSFRVVGTWREHDTGDYRQGRVPDNSMVLQIVLRAALDRMAGLRAFSWELSVAPLQTVYQSLVLRPALAALTIRCQGSRTPRPTTIIPPLPHLETLVVYDIDPLCYPDDFSLLILGSKKLQNLKLHWSPRMRDSGEESTNLLTIFGRCMAARYAVPLKRLAVYNLYTRFHSEAFNDVVDHITQTEVTVINSLDSSDPMTVFLDNVWKVNHRKHIPVNLKMLRVDNVDSEGAAMLSRFSGLERLYLVSKRPNKHLFKAHSAATVPSTPLAVTPGATNSTESCNGTPTATDHTLCSSASDYLAAIQTHHRTIRHLLLSDRWQLSDDAFFKLCQSCPNLEQLGLSCLMPPLESLRQFMAMLPKLWALRFLVAPNTDLADKMASIDTEMHKFAVATEFWRPEYRNLKYVSMDDRHVYKLGEVYFPPKADGESSNDMGNTMNARRSGPIRRVDEINIEDMEHVEIWAMDTTEFDPAFP